MNNNLFFRSILSILLGLAMALSPNASLQAAASAGTVTKIDIVGPTGSGQFGRSVNALPNGNIVVGDPYYDAGSVVDVGAVYLYDGETGALISRLTGSQANDRVGFGYVEVLGNGNYIVRSLFWNNGSAAEAGAVTLCSGIWGCGGAVAPKNSLVGWTSGDQVGSVEVLDNDNYVVASRNWDNGLITDAGAVTWCSGVTGCVGPVTPANSLVGSSAGDQVGGTWNVGNGNYVVSSTNWDNDADVDAGAATWCNGSGGCIGPVSASNSLVGSTSADRVGIVKPLQNGNYVVFSRFWDNGAVADAGAVTWANGESGITGPISAANSLIGSSANDQVGYQVSALRNGNYVVASPTWDYGSTADVGAVTWGNGSVGAKGVVSVANSLTGSTPGDKVGSWYVTELSDSDYVVTSAFWDNGAAVDAGAATWCAGSSGCVGTVSPANSVVGSTSGDQVGGVTPLNNGNYLSSGYLWDHGTTADVGAVRWCNGTDACTGAISPGNSLFGSTANDWVGYNIKVLTNGNYVVISSSWDNGAVVNAGAVTWGNGATGVTGQVSATNSLVGGQANDVIGSSKVTPLTNGNYVVNSPNWDNGVTVNAGAATWGNGASGSTGMITTANSLVGSLATDYVGNNSLALANGNYVVNNWYWDNGSAVDAGAVTWCSGSGICAGIVSPDNSLVGSTAGDKVGEAYQLNDSDYLVLARPWDNGAITDAGAITWGNGAGGSIGSITAQNSVLGTTIDNGDSMDFVYDGFNRQLVVARPGDNIVTLFRVSYNVYLPVLFKQP